MLAGSSVVSCFVLSNYSKLLNTSATHGGFYCKPDGGGGWHEGTIQFYRGTRRLIARGLRVLSASFDNITLRYQCYSNFITTFLGTSELLSKFATVLFIVQSLYLLIWNNFLQENSTQQFLTTLRCQTNDNCNILQKTTTVQFSCLCRWQNNTKAPDTERFLLSARCVKNTRLIHYCLYDVTLMPFGQRTETNHRTLHSKQYKSTSMNSNVHKMVQQKAIIETFLTNKRS